MVHVLEHALTVAGEVAPPPGGRGSERWTWVIDFRGFSMWHAMQFRTSAQTLRTFSSHMPERLSAVLLVAPPGIFDVLLAVCRPMLDARTLSKVHVVRPTGEGAALRESVAGVLAPHGVVDPGIVEWVAAALAEPTVAPLELPSVAPLGEVAAKLQLGTPPVRGV